MKRGLIILILSLFITFFACSPKKENQPNPISISTIHKKEKKISIEKVGSIEFDISFSFLQSQELNKKEIDKLYRETEKSNPFKIDTTNESLRKRFEELGLVKGRDLLLSKFKYQSIPEFSFIGITGKEIKIKIVRDSARYGNDKIVAFSNSDSSEIRIAIFMELKYALIDIIPGGNKEVVILDESYVSNTEIYILEVYEIKTRD